MQSGLSNDLKKAYKSIKVNLLFLLNYITFMTIGCVKWFRVTLNLAVIFIFVKAIHAQDLF